MVSFFSKLLEPLSYLSLSSVVTLLQQAQRPMTASSTQSSGSFNWNGSWLQKGTPRKQDTSGAIQGDQVADTPDSQVNSQVTTIEPSLVDTTSGLIDGSSLDITKVDVDDMWTWGVRSSNLVDTCIHNTTHRCASPRSFEFDHT